MGRRRLAVRFDRGLVVQETTEDAVERGEVEGIIIDPAEAPELDARVQATRDRGGRPIPEELARAGGARALAQIDELTFGLNRGAMAIAATALQGGSPSDVYENLEEVREQLAAIEAEYPVATTLGRVEGALAPALLTGGESLLARGALLSPGGLAAGVGNVAERYVARNLLRGSPRLARGLGVTAGASAEGLVGGTIQAFTNAQIEGTPLEAESVLASAGLGTVLGLGSGGLFALPGLARGGRVALQQGAELAARGLDDIAPMSAREGIPVIRLPEADIPLGGLASVMSGVDQPAMRVAAANPDIAFDRAVFSRRVHETGATLENSINDLRAATRSITDSSARQRVLLEASQGLDETATATAISSIGRLRSTINDLTLGNPSELAGVARVTNDVDVGILRRLFNHIDSIGRIRTPQDAVRAMDSVLDYTSSNRLANRASPELRAVLFGSPGAPGLMDTALTSAAETGMGDAGIMLANAHRALRDWREIDTAVGPIVGREMAGPGGIQFRVDQARLGSALTDQTGEEVRRNVLDPMSDWFRKSYRLADVAEQFGATEAEASRRQLDEAATRLGADAAIGRVRAQMRQAGIDESQGSGLMASLGFSGRGLGTSIAGGVAGGALGGVPGAALGAGAGFAFGALSHPVGTLQRLARLKQWIGSTQRRIAVDTQRLGEAMFRKSPLAEASRHAPLAITAMKDPATREEEYNTVLTQVRTLAGNPEALTMRIQEVTGPVADQISTPLADFASLTMATGVQYMLTQIPPADIPSPFDHLQNLTPSQVEMDTFTRKYEALQDPVGIINMAAEGRLTSEHVTAVRSVYPALFAAIQAEVSQMVGSLDRLPPYAARLQVGTLLDTPIDNTMNNRFIFAMQRQYAQTREQQNTQVSRTANSISTRISDHTFSESQELSLRL